MLEEQDYKKIKEIFNEQGKQLFNEQGKQLFDVEGKKLEERIVNQIGEVIEDNILPAINEILDKKITPLPDKAYLDDKLADLEGSVIVRQKKEDKKVNLLIEILKEKKILLDDEVSMLQEFQIFPQAPKVTGHVV